MSGQDVGEDKKLYAEKTMSHLETDAKRIGQVKDVPEFDNGYYITGHVNKPVDFLIDTGSNVTIISDRIYCDITRAGIRINLRPANILLQTVSGSAIDTCGEAEVEIRLGDTFYPFPVIVAAISQDGILGNDFISQHVNSFNFT